MTTVARTTAYEWLDDQGRYVTDEVYHGATDIVGNSSLKAFSASPKKYHALFVAKTRPMDEPGEALNIGSWLHCAVLEPERWRDGFAVAPKCDKRTTAGKAIYAAFEAESFGKTIVDCEAYSLVNAMREALMANPTIHELVEAEGFNERPIRWTDAETGIELKSKQDRCIPSRELLLDLKTDRGDISPAAWSKTAFNFGYHRQNDLYVSGQHELSGERYRFAFCVVSKSTLETAVYELDDEAVSLGYRENRKALEKLARCHETGIWQAAHEQQVTKLSLPAWAFSQSAYEVE